MLRAGDIVHKWNEMHRVGTVEKLIEYNTTQWMAGGAPGKRLFASVRYDKENVVDIPVNDLIMVERP